MYLVDPNTKVIINIDSIVCAEAVDDATTRVYLEYNIVKEIELPFNAIQHMITPLPDFIPDEELS